MRANLLLSLALWMQQLGDPSHGFVPSKLQSFQPRAARVAVSPPESKMQRQVRSWDDDEYEFGGGRRRRSMMVEEDDIGYRSEGGDLAYYDDRDADRSVRYNRGYQDRRYDRGYGNRDRMRYREDRRSRDFSRPLSPGNWDDDDLMTRLDVPDSLSTMGGSRRRTSGYGEEYRPRGRTMRRGRPIQPDPPGRYGARGDFVGMDPVLERDDHMMRGRPRFSRRGRPLRPMDGGRDYFPGRMDPLLERDDEYVRGRPRFSRRGRPVRPIEDDIIMDDYVDDNILAEEEYVRPLPRRDPYRFRSNSYRSEAERFRQRRLEELRLENEDLEEELAAVRARARNGEALSRMDEEEIRRLEDRMASLEASMDEFTVAQRREHQDLRRETTNQSYRMENQMESFVNSMKNFFGSRSEEPRLPSSSIREFPEDFDEDIDGELQDRPYLPRSRRFDDDPERLRSTRSMSAYQRYPDYQGGRGGWRSRPVRADSHMNAYPGKVAAYPETWR